MRSCARGVQAMDYGHALPGTPAEPMDMEPLTMKRPEYPYPKITLAPGKVRGMRRPKVGGGGSARWQGSRRVAARGGCPACTTACVRAH